MIERLISKYSVFLLYIYAFLLILGIGFGHIVLYLINLVNLFIIFTNIPVMNRDKTGLVKCTSLYVIMMLIYQIATPTLPESYNPYNPLFYYLFAVTGLSYWILGRKGYNVFSINNVKIIASIIVLLLLSMFLKLLKAGGVSNMINGEDDYIFYYQVLPYLFLWVTAICLLLNTKWQFVIFLLFAIFIILSTKRGPLVSLFLGYIAIFLAKGKLSIKTFVKYGLIFILLFGIIYYVSGNFFNEWMDRVNTDETEDISNGRELIWGIVLYDYYNSDLIHQIIGHGHEATHYVTGNIWGNAIGAHNDFIDVIYNMGIIGLLVFLSMIYMWCKCLYIGIKNKYQYSYLLAYLIVCFLLGSYVSSNMTRYATIFFGAIFYFYAGFLEYSSIKKDGKNS